MKFRTTLLIALMMLGAAPAIAQNLTETDVRFTQNKKFQRAARIEAAKQRRLLRYRAAVASRGHYGLATTKKYRHSHKGHPEFYGYPPITGVHPSR